MGISGWYTGLTDDVKDLTKVAGFDVDDIWGMELYYNYQVTPSTHLTADFQLLQNGNDDDDVAIVPGLRLVTSF